MVASFLALVRPLTGNCLNVKRHYPGVNAVGNLCGRASDHQGMLTVVHKRWEICSEIVLDNTQKNK